MHLCHQHMHLILYTHRTYRWKGWSTPKVVFLDKLLLTAKTVYVLYIDNSTCVYIYISTRNTLKKRFLYMNTCWAPHLKMSPKCFIMAVIVLSSSSKQTHCILVICDSKCVTVECILNIHQSGSSAVLIIMEICKAPTLCLKVLNKHNIAHHNVHQDGKC